MTLYIFTCCKREEREVTIIKKEITYTYLDINGKLEGRVKSEEVLDYKEGEVIKVQIISEDKEGNYVICSRRKIEERKHTIENKIKKLVMTLKKKIAKWLKITANDIAEIDGYAPKKF